MQKSYSYDKRTGVFIKEGNYIINHLDEIILGAYETINQPPTTDGYQVARYLDKAGNVPTHCSLGEASWEIHDNFIGTIYYEKSGERIEITEFNKVVPKDTLTIEPPEFCDKHDGVNWIHNIEKIRKAKLEEAAQKRKEIEVSGININGVSCADFRLDTDDIGQTKISGAVTEAKDLPELPAITDWYTLDGWREVTNADIIVMAKAVHAHVKKTFSEMKRIQEEIEVLSTVEDVENYKINFNMT
jgi:hypothetical protein